MADKRTWMPVAAGILDIVCGSVTLFISGLLGIIGTVGSAVLNYFPVGIPPAVVAAVFSALAIPFTLLGILAIVGGVYALQRKKWGLALVGSIAAFFPPKWILGIAAIVLTVLAREEFE
ncbi:MAG: hypothetical protein FJ008_08325 [Chloroflexi bacterium]|nr:hypothetical protein [Chloroflexota bacterium]MBM3173995.1 hypothetical protein [Chloroflexota bacterium]